MDLTNIEKYSELCDNDPTIPIFSHNKWLNVVCGKGNWDVSIVENKNNEIIAALPYYINRNRGFNRFSLPQLTQKMGPWIKYPSVQKYEAKISFEHKIMSELICNLPKFDEFFHKVDHKYQNILPFYWNGFKSSVFYTYQLTDLTNVEDVFRNFRSNIRTDIKKAQNNNIIITESSDIEMFYQINKKTFERQKIKIPYSFRFIKSLDKALMNNRKIYFATDENNQIHAVAYIVWDKECAYYLMGGGDPSLRNSGATSLLMWTAIKDMSNVVNVFDFEGSMLQPVERFFRGFGARQTPYYGVSKVNSKRLKIYYFLQDLLAR